ncbi:MAG: guanylate kinase [Phycisphaerae bacterium]
MPNTGKLVVVTGPSGVGKSSILRRALPRTGARFSVSATTRPPREGETPGEDYHFVSREAFEDMIAHGEMLEYAEVHGELYGTPAQPVMEAVGRGETIVLDVDVQGGIQVHEKKPDATFVLIVPPSDEELARRLTGRGTDSQQQIQRRLGVARQEVQTARESGFYRNVVVNDDLESATREVVSILQG